MKKALAIGQLIIGLLVLISIVIILGVLGPAKLQDLTKPILGWMQPKQDESGFAITPNVQPPKQDITVKDKNEVLNKIVNTILECWKIYIRKRPEDFRCIIISWEKETFTKTQFVSLLEKKDTRAAQTFESFWRCGDRERNTNEAKPGRYLICADQRAWSGNALYFTSDLEHTCDSPSWC